MLWRYGVSAGVLCLLVLLSGCVTRYKPLLLHTPREQHGKVYFLPGAGNFGIGEKTVPSGLKQAGYRGSVEVFNWTTRWMGPAVDQMWMRHARKKAKLLAEKIQAYYDSNPDREVNLIGHSAGTGVATWALELLPARLQVNNLVLLSSSLSRDYDMTSALEHVKGKVYVFSSRKDRILRWGVKASGTVDRKFGVSCVGEVGLSPPPGAGRHALELYEQKVVNIPYRVDFNGAGWEGDHISVVSSAFMAHHVAPKIFLPSELGERTSRPALRQRPRRRRLFWR